MVYCFMQLECGFDLVEVWKLEGDEGRATLSAGKLILRVQLTVGRLNSI
jgi:hypothetical protein